MTPPKIPAVSAVRQEPRPPEIAKTNLKRWRIELGGNSRFQLKLVSDALQGAEGIPPLFNETRVYDLSPRGIDVSIQWKLRGRPESKPQIAVLLDRGLELVEASCGETAVAWTIESLPDNRGERAILQFPPSFSVANRALRLRAIAPLVMGRLWRLPRIRAEGMTWEDGTISVAAISPLSLERLMPVECSQTATGPLAAPRLGESAQFRCFNSEATIETALALHRGEVKAAVATAVAIGGGEISARVAGDFRSAESSQFALEANVAPAWRIDEVTSVPTEAIADWNFETRSDGDRRLTIRLARSIGLDQPVQVIVTARRLRLPTERGLKFHDLQPLHYLPPVESRRWLSLKSVGRNELAIRGNNQPRRVLLKDIPASESGLFSGISDEMLFAEDDADDDAEVVVEGRLPEYSAAIRMEAEARGGRLQESWKIRCVPASTPVEKILVRISGKSDAPTRWQASGAKGLMLTARRLPQGAGAASGAKKSAETWQITFNQPQSDPFELHGVRESVFEGPCPLGLASLPEASRQNGTLIIRRTAKTGIRIENRRLKRLPPEPSSLASFPTIWATFSYDPTRDAINANEPSILLAPADRPLSSACAWSVLLESWHEPGGVSRYSAVWELQLGDRERAQITLPAGIDPTEVSGVWIDGQPAAWQPIIEVNTAAENADSSKLSVLFPAEKRFATLAVEFAVRDQPLGITGTIASRLPNIDLPVLSASWRMWLPADYEAVEGRSPGCPLFAHRKTLGKCLWGPLGRDADERRFRIFSAEDWIGIAGDPDLRRARRNLEKMLRILDQALEQAESKGKDAPILWRDILESNADWSSSPRLLVDRLSLDRLGLSGQTPLAASRRAGTHAPYRRSFGEDAACPAGFRRFGAIDQSNIGGALQPAMERIGGVGGGNSLRGPLADRLSEVSAEEGEGRYLPAGMWARLPPKPESPWDRGGSLGAKSYDMRGWNAVRRELSVRGTVSVSYLHRPAFQIAGLVIFLAVAAGGWWFLLRRLPVLIFIAAGFALTALVLSEPYAALASWAMLGTCFCILLRFAIRDRATDDTRASIAPKSESKPSMPEILENTVVSGAGSFNGAADGSAGDSSRDSASGSVAKLLLIAAALTGGSWLQADELPIEDAATPVSASPVYRVFVPTDAAKKPVGDKVFVPQGFYDELYRRAGKVSNKPRDWLLTSAVYRGSLVRDSASGRMAIESLQARLELHTFSRAVRVRIPLRRDDANLLADNVLLDGRPLRIQWEPGGRAVFFNIDEPGDYRLELSLRPEVRTSYGGAGFEVSIPRSADARLELLLPSDPPSVEVPSALGKVEQENEPPRIIADLGPADRLSVAWQEGGAGEAVAEIDELLWLKVQPGSVVLDVRLKGNSIAGRLQKMQLAVDPRLRLQPPTGPDAPTVQVQNPPDQPQLITLQWAQPLPEQATVGISFLMTGASGVGSLHLPLLQVQHFRTGKRWLGISVDSQLEYNAPHPTGMGPAIKAEVELLATNEFLKAWVTASYAPLMAYRLGAAADWSLSTKPREPSITAEPTLALSFDRERVEMDFAARLTVVSGYVFQYRLLGPKELSVQTVSVKKDGMEMVGRWTQDTDGAITVFLTGPAEGRQELQLRGVMPLSRRLSLPLPALRMEQAGSEPMQVRVYRRPGVLVEVTPPLGATSFAFPDARGDAVGKGCGVPRAIADSDAGG